MAADDPALERIRAAAARIAERAARGRVSKFANPRTSDPQLPLPAAATPPPRPWSDTDAEDDAG